MIVTQAVKHVINVGPYESLTVEASVTVNTETDLDDTATDAEVIAYLNDVLTQIIKPELDEARALSTTVPGSHIHDYSLR